MRWFKNLKKWQQGGLSGCAVGLLFAAIIILSPHRDSPGEWLVTFHGIFFISFWLLNYQLGISEYNPLGVYLIEYGGSAAIVVFYGGLGALFGRIQQVTKPAWKWSLTALLALFLLFFYMLHAL